MDAQPQHSPSLPQRCDVAVIGAGLAGAATALMIRRRVPGARVEIFEREEARGDSELLGVRGEVSALLAHEWGLEQALVRDHLPLHGVRYWCAHDSTRTLAGLHELGESHLPATPAFHVDSGPLTASLLELATRAGVTCHRGSEVQGISLARPRSSLTVRDGSGTHTLEAAWIVDASGAHGALELQREEVDLRLELSRARWSGLRAWSEFEGLVHSPGLRSLAEHHFLGEGWRVRLAPLRSGECELLVSLDPAIAPELSDEFDGLRGLQDHGRFVRSRAGLRELLRGASVSPESFRSRKLEMGYADPVCGPGWFAVGAAAGELDPFDGAPLRQLVETTRAAAELISADLVNFTRDVGLEWPRRAQAFREQFRRRACRLGEGAYLLYGDAALANAATSLDLGLELLPLQRRLTHGVGAWLRARLVRIAQARRVNGLYGTPQGKRLGGLPSRATPQLLRGLAAWAGLEFAGFREHFTPVPGDLHTSASVELRQYAEARAKR